MLDILLLTILTEKDEVERTSALVFLEEHGESLVWDEELSIGRLIFQLPDCRTASMTSPESLFVSLHVV